MSDQAVVLALVEDMFFVARIESVTENMGIVAKFVDQFSVKSADDFFDVLETLRPQLVILDLNAREIPWEAWVVALKEHAEFSDIPVLAFGSHKAIDVMKTAKEAGVDQVVAKSRFVQGMSELISKHL